MPEAQLKVIFHDLCLTNYPTASCETPERVMSIMETLRRHYAVIEPPAASEEDILLVHSQHILRAVKKEPEVYMAAIVAAGGAILAAELASEGEPTFAAVRPPGHHASPGSHWGFCFFNNVAVAIEKLIRRRKISHALILDIDLHFGDGTDNFFLDRRDVVVANIQENSRERFLRKVELATSSNEYDMIAISAGFDRHVEDWGGTLTTEDYFTIGRNVRDQAMARCDGKYFAVLEGGYNTGVLGENALALCRGMDPGTS
jgi:acetoin utilization deacetylase AcuC-like enzyme